MKNFFFLTIILGVSISLLIQNTDSLFDEPTTALYARTGMFQIIYIIGLVMVGALSYFGHDYWEKRGLMGNVLLVGIGVTFLAAAAFIGGKGDTLFTPKGYTPCAQVDVRVTSKNTLKHMVYHKNQAACYAFKAQIDNNPTAKVFRAALNTINQEYK